MKKFLINLTGVSALAMFLAVPAFADDAVTITGDGKCAKCALKKADSCQNVIETTEKGKTVTYYIAKNDVSKEFHSNICQESKKITATGTVKEVDGKKELTATKIALVK